MAQTIPSSAHAVGDPGHTPDHDNIADMLSLLAQTQALDGGNSPLIGNAALVTALQAMVTGWAGYNTSSYQFYPEAYGAFGDGKIVTDGAMTSGQATLTCATSAPFVAADVGKWVNVAQAGGGTYTSLCAQITGFTSASAVTLSANATFTCSGSIVIYGHDDTAAINAAVTAAYTAWNANKKLLPSVLFSQKIYCLGGTASPVNSTAATGAGLGNALIPLPVIPTTTEKLTLVFQGVPDSTGLLHWQELLPQTSGSCIACLRTDGTNDATYGESHVIGGPFHGYGPSGSFTGVFSNMLAVVDGIEVMAPYNGTYGGFDFYGVAEANVVNACAMAIGTVPAGPPFPSQGTPSNITNFIGYGLRMPSAFNNDDALVMVYACEGFARGFAPSEHTVALSVRLINCYNPIVPYTGGAGGMLHRIKIVYASAENYQGAAVTPLDSAPIYFDIDSLDTETSVGLILSDAGNLGQGYIGFLSASHAGYTTGGVTSGGTGVKVVDLANSPGPVTSGAPAAPATTVAQGNYFYRDAFVYVTSTAAISVVKINGTTITGLATAGAGTLAVPVPSGETYAVTSSGTITTQWVLL